MAPLVRTVVVMCVLAVLMLLPASLTLMRRFRIFFPFYLFPVFTPFCKQWND
jgi:hypothetical protein